MLCVYVYVRVCVCVCVCVCRFAVNMIISIVAKKKTYIPSPETNRGPGQVLGS